MKGLYVYLLLTIMGIGNSSSFAFSPAPSHNEGLEVLQQDHHNLPLFSEEIEGTFILQIVSGKQPGNQGKITAFITHSIIGPEVIDFEEPSVFLQLQKILLNQHIFPFHFFW
ncbi:MAG TPA: hypothetical protein VK941_12520 [Gillisia sp.]|nr:hypothetical protein [Gillisia sp.]